MRLISSLYMVQRQKNEYEKEIHKKADNGVYQVLAEATQRWQLQEAE